MPKMRMHQWGAHPTLANSKEPRCRRMLPGRRSEFNAASCQRHCLCGLESAESPGMHCTNSKSAVPHGPAHCLCRCPGLCPGSDNHPTPASCNPVLSSGCCVEERVHLAVLILKLFNILSPFIIKFRTQAMSKWRTRSRNSNHLCQSFQVFNSVYIAICLLR